MGVTKAGSIFPGARRIPAGVALGAALAALLAGCGDSQGTGPGQVVARVNGADITVRELDSELSVLGLHGASRDERNTKRVIEGLIDQQLLVHEAIEANLEEDPQVLLATERARRQILSDAFVERSLKVPQPGADEVKAFYSTHTELFQKRRIFSFNDYLIDRAQFPDALRPRLEAAKTRGEAEAIMKDANVPYRVSASTRGAEQLPLDVLPRIAAMEKGGFALLESGATVILMQLVDFTEQPLTLEQASPYIERYLVNALRKELADRKLRELRASARIVFPNQEEGDGPGGGWAFKSAVAERPQRHGAPDEYINRGVQGMAGR